MMNDSFFKNLCYMFQKAQFGSDVGFIQNVCLMLFSTKLRRKTLIIEYLVFHTLCHFPSAICLSDCEACILIVSTPRFK